MSCFALCLSAAGCEVSRSLFRKAAFGGNAIHWPVDPKTMYRRSLKCCATTKSLGGTGWKWVLRIDWNNQKCVEKKWEQWKSRHGRWTRLSLWARCAMATARVRNQRLPNVFFVLAFLFICVKVLYTRAGQGNARHGWSRHRPRFSSL